MMMLRLEDAQFFRRGRKHFTAVPGDRYGIFDAEAAGSFHVNTGLYGYRHALLERYLLFPANSRWLMDFQTQAVPGGMYECAVEPVGRQDAPCGTVHRVRAYPGPDG